MEETRTTLLSVGFDLPYGYQLQFVENSESLLTLYPSGWMRNVGDVSQNSKRYSIEVVSQYGKTMAGVIWKEKTVDGHRTIWSDGTFVSSHLQRKGLATKLWNLMISMRNPDNVIGEAATEDGFHFLSRLSVSHPKLLTFSVMPELCQIRPELYQGVPQQT